MAFFGNTNKPNQQQDTPTTSLSSNQLTQQEIGMLLSMIKKTTFIGEDVESLYNLIIKLQQQYLEQNTK